MERTRNRNGAAAQRSLPSMDDDESLLGGQHDGDDADPDTLDRPGPLEQAPTDHGGGIGAGGAAAAAGQSMRGRRRNAAGAGVDMSFGAPSSGAGVEGLSK